MTEKDSAGWRHCPKRSEPGGETHGKNFFGKTTKGEEASLYTLTNSNGMKVSVTDLGATIVSVCVPDGKGVLTDVVLGYRKPRIMRLTADFSVL